MLDKIDYNPDVLTCLANLSNDEVFTPPELVNDILDLLPKELFENKETTFLDPVTKSGVFLREIAKRLMHGLKDEIPDKQTRINHIFKNQLYGIAITELTSLLARRSVYCSKEANGKYSICEDFETEQGNILFERVEHSWQGGKCKYCGASEKNYARGDELETHAYQFIHTEKPKELFKMKFDVIIGNPPYQLETGGSNKQATPIYNKFIEQAKKLNPRFLSMIVPARWYAGGMGLKKFRADMISDRRISTIHDFPVTSDCFPGLNIRGGVCYFLWDRGYSGKCKVYNWNNGISNQTSRHLDAFGDGVFLRYNAAISIIEKVQKFNEKSFDSFVSSQKPFGLPTNFIDYVQKKDDEHQIRLYKSGKSGFIAYDSVLAGHADINKFKVLIAKASPGSDVFPHLVLSKPIITNNNSCCTETYLSIFPSDSKAESKFVASYLCTMFARFMILMMKPTQDVLKKSYSMLPVQNFDKLWTDEELFDKYSISDKEVAFIKSMIRPMELDNE